MSSTLSRVAACTIVAENYLPFARVLAGSFRDHHPNCPLYVLVVDGREARAEDRELFTALTLYDLALEEGEAERMALSYDVTELSTAVKPWLLRRLLRDHAEVMFFDPDIEVFQPLDDLHELAGVHGIVLTPHVLDPVPRDGRRPSEEDVLKSGIFNLGFLALSDKAGDFVDWWQVRLRRDAVIDPGRMLFTDQRWIDFVPGMFDHLILRDRGCNVAYWNVDERSIGQSSGSWTAAGAPLRFFHFSGFDPRRPTVLSKHALDRPRIQLEDHPALARLCADYGNRLVEAGFDAASGAAYGWGGLSDGTRVDDAMRTAYRSALLRFEAGEAAEPPNPFAASSPTEFLDWLNESFDSPSTGVSRYLHAVREARPDLRRAFPDLRGRGGEAFLDWARSSGRREAAFPERLVPPQLAQQGVEAPGRRGVSVLGYFSAELGVGETGRMVADALRRAAIPVRTLTLDGGLSRQNHPWTDERADGATFGVNIVVANADQVPHIAREHADLLADGYTIALWAWELEEFPRRYWQSFEHVDEVWANSTYSQRAIQACTEKPVLAVPLGVTPPDPTLEPLDRGELGIPEGFLFLFMFDFLSVAVRKNPLGLVEAYRRAFRPDDGCVLVLKSINGDRLPKQLAEVRQAAEEREDVVLLDQYLDPVDRQRLFAACDAYVSLHRSEGYGLTLAEAMAIGKPVIATRYSGNLDFMTDENSFLVRAERAPVPRGCDPYPAGSTWSEPDLDDAARLLQLVLRDPAERQARAERARLDMRACLDDGVLTSFVADRIAHGQSVLQERAPAAPGDVRPSMPVKDSRASPRVKGLNVLARRVVQRITRHDLDHQQRVNDWLSHELLAVNRELSGVSRQLSAATDRLAQLEQQLEQQLGTAEAEIAGLVDELRAPPFVSDPDLVLLDAGTEKERLGYRRDGQDSRSTYVDFEDAYRGSEDFIRERMTRYVPILGGYSQVVDLGCGRGELLEVLRAEGVEAFGVDSNEAMIDRCREKGLAVAHADLLEWLDGTQETFGAVFSAQVVEHLTWPEIRRLLSLARERLEPGGAFVAETVNPHSLRALRVFHLDPTHVAPIFPEALLDAASQAGFSSGEIVFPFGTGLYRDDRHSQGEYALIAHP